MNTTIPIATRSTSIDQLVSEVLGIGWSVLLGSMQMRRLLACQGAR
jgi:hypothetical protein